VFFFALAAALIFPTHALKPVSCYAYKQGSVKVEWTAYKFTEKTGVKGTFKTISTRFTTPPQSEDEMLLATTFEIDSLSVDSGNAARDMNVSQNFFKLMIAPKITGRIKGIKDGKAIVELKMNDVTRLVDFKYEKKDGKILATSSIDILDFSMQPSLKKINEVCYELHKGKDGISKTWSTIDLSISAEPIFTCKKGK
jgi:polyisoprenoid-binding protein YceI